MLWARLVIAVLLWPVSTHGAELAYVAHESYDLVSVVDLQTDSVIRSVELGDALHPASLALSPDGRFAYVGSHTGTFAAVDLATGDIVKRVRIGQGRTFVAADPAGDRIYATATTSCGLSIIDASTLEIVGNVPGPQNYQPAKFIQAKSGGGLAAFTDDYLFIFDSRDGRLVAEGRRTINAWQAVSIDRFILIPNANLMHVIDTASGSERGAIVVPKDAAPLSVPLADVTGFALAPERGMILALAGSRLGVVGTYYVEDARALAVDGETGRLYVAVDACSVDRCPASDVIAIDAATGATLGSIPLELRTHQVVLSPDRTQLLATHPHDSKVSLIDASFQSDVFSVSVEGGSITGNNQTDVAFSPDNESVYVVTSVGLYAVDRDSGAVRPLASTTHPARLAATPDGRRVFVADFYSRSLTVLDAGSAAVVRTIELEGYLAGVAAAPDGRHAYVIHSDPQAVSVVDTVDGDVRTFPLSDGVFLRHPRHVDVSPDGTNLYVSVWRQSGSPEQGYDDDGAHLVLVDVATETIVRELSIRTADARSLLDPQGRFLIVPRWPGLSIVDPTLVDGSPLGEANDLYDLHVALSPDGALAYAFGNGPAGDEVVIFDTDTRTAIDRVSSVYVHGSLHGGADGALYGTAYDSLVRIDPGRDWAVEAIPLPHHASDVAIVDAPARPAPEPQRTDRIPPGLAAQRAYMPHYDGTLSVLDGASSLSTYDVGVRLDGLKLSGDGQRLVALSADPCESQCDTELVILDANTLQTEVAIPLGGVAYPPLLLSPDGSRAYLMVFETGELLVVDLHRGDLSARAEIGLTGDLALDRRGENLFVVSTSFADATSNVTRVDLATLAVERTATLFDSRVGPRIGGDRGFFYVGPLWSGTAQNVAAVGTLDPETLDLTATAPVAGFVHEIVPDGVGRTYFASGPCLTRAEAGQEPLKIISRAAEESVSRLAVGPETSVIYALADRADALLLIDAETADTLSRIPIRLSATSLAVGDHPQAPARATLTPTATFTVTFTPTPTATPTPTSTPTHTSPPVVIAIGSASGFPGADVDIEIVLHTRGLDVVGLQNDIGFAPPLTITSCAANPALGKELSGFRIGDTSITALVVGYDVRAIDDGAVLYTCRLRIATDAEPGRHVLRGAAAIAGSPKGERLMSATTDGHVDVLPVAVTGNDGSTSVGASSGSGGCTLRNDAAAGAGQAWVFLAMVGLALIRTTAVARPCRRRYDRSR